MHEGNKLHICLVQVRLHNVPGDIFFPVAIYPSLSVDPPLKVYNINTPGLVMIDIFKCKLVLDCQQFLIPIQQCIVVLQGWFSNVVSHFLSPQNRSFVGFVTIICQLILCTLWGIQLHRDL